MKDDGTPFYGEIDEEIAAEMDLDDLCVVCEIQAASDDSDMCLACYAELELQSDPRFRREKWDV